MIDISFNFPQDQLAEMNRQIERLVQVSRKGGEHAIKRAMMFVLKSFRATTKEAPKRRKVERADFIQTRRRKDQRNDGGLFKVIAFNRKSGKEEPRIFAADSLSEAREHPLTIIKFSGLAKRSWGWAMRDLFSTGGDTDSGFRRKPGMVETKVDKSEGQFAMRVDDNIRYVTEAFKTKGRATADNIIKRAGNNIRKDVERAIAGSNAWARS